MRVPCGPGLVLPTHMMKERARVALVSGGLGFGGTTVFLSNLANGLRSLGIPSAIFSLTRANPFGAEFEAAGVPTYVADENSLIFEDRLALLCRKLAEFKPTVMIANIGVEAYELFRYAPEGITRIGMVHDLAFEPHRWLPEYEDVLDGVVVVNAHLLADIQRAAPRLKSSYLAHGIPVSKEPPRVANPSGPLKLIYFGRLEPAKGTRVFLEIMTALRQRKIPFRWTIHGSGTDEGFLHEKLAAEVAAGEVVLSSKVPRDKLYSLVRQHDIFIMASEMEGGPLTLLEAMSLGLVPVCNEIPCMIQEVINSTNGFRVPRDSEAYAESLAKLDRNRTLLEQMSAAAREAITKNYTIEAMAGRYLEFINALTSDRAIVSWPARIEPRPMRASTPIRRLAQIGIVRPFRRMLKRIRS